MLPLMIICSLNFQIISFPESSNIALPSQAKPFFNDALYEREAVMVFHGSSAGGYFPLPADPGTPSCWNTQIFLPGKPWLEQIVCSSAAASNLWWLLLGNKCSTGKRWLPESSSRILVPSPTAETGKAVPVSASLSCSKETEGTRIQAGLFWFVL